MRKWVMFQAWDTFSSFISRFSRPSLASDPRWSLLTSQTTKSFKQTLTIIKRFMKWLALTMLWILWLTSWWATRRVTIIWKTLSLTNSQSSLLFSRLCFKFQTQANLMCAHLPAFGQLNQTLRMFKKPWIIKAVSGASTTLLTYGLGTRQNIRLFVNRRLS